MKNDIYFIKWLDSQSDDGWIFYSKRHEISPMVMNTVGHLIHEDKKLIRIACSLGNNKNGSNKQFNGTIIIPKRAILRMKKIKWKSQR